MTPPEQASQIVQKHFKIIESYIIFHGMTEMEMMKMAKEHAAQEVRGTIGVINRLVDDCNDKDWAILATRSSHYYSVLRELQAK